MILTYLVRAQKHLLAESPLSIGEHTNILLGQKSN